MTANKEITTRTAVTADSAALTTLRNTVWPDDPTSTVQIEMALQQAEYRAVVAVDGGAVIGFADGFMTLAADGLRRWEVDLLAVHSGYRGLGVARRLIAASVGQGHVFGAQAARALIQIDNIASGKAFAASGFSPEAHVSALVVSSVGGRPHTHRHTTAHFLPVCTFGYTGVWIEGQPTEGDFAVAQDIRKHYGWDAAGAVLPVDSDALQAALRVGYTQVGLFRYWWHRY